MQEYILIILGSSAATIFVRWLLFPRKHKAETNSVEKTNDATEIENLVSMVKEWRETATSWKNLADEYQQELISCKTVNGKLIEELKKEVRKLRTELSKANSRIKELENH